MAEDKRSLAIQYAIEMDYRSAKLLFERIVPVLPENLNLKRWYARTLTHLGLWDEAAGYFESSVLDSTIAKASENDLERLRFFAKGVVKQPLYTGVWERLRVNFAAGRGIGAVQILPDGTIAAAVPERNLIEIWSPSGSRIATIKNTGFIASITTYNNLIYAGDLITSKVFVISSELKVEKVIDLTKIGVHGIRDIESAGDGSFYIADIGSRRIVRIDAEGNLISEIGVGKIEKPSSVLLHKNDIFIGDEAKDAVLRFDVNGRLLKSYSVPALSEPVALVEIDGGFLVQAKNGKVFLSFDDENGIMTMLRLKEGPLVTSHFGLSVDRFQNIWWGDGNSIRSARRIPFPAPMYSVEILKVVQGSRRTAGNSLDITVSVMEQSGKSLMNLDKNSFRIFKEKTQLFPIQVQNLSKTLQGRRFALLIEQSDEILPHREALTEVIKKFTESLSGEDKTCIIDVRDTFRIVRDFTISNQLLFNAFTEERPRVSGIDVSAFEALSYSIELLAPSDYARAVILITSGQGLTESDAVVIKRMSIINQVNIFIIHIGEKNRELLEDIAVNSNGEYLELYKTNSAKFNDMLALIHSGRYKISVPSGITEPMDRGRWFNLTCEVKYFTETLYDKSGYFAY